VVAGTGSEGFLVAARASDDDDRRRRLDAAVAVLAGTAPVEVRRSQGDGDLPSLLADAGRRTVVIAGGDGSVHRVVNELRSSGALTGTLVGLIPLGTGNDLARGLGLPLDAADAARALLAGERRRLDLLESDGGTVVTNAVHAGLGARAAAVATGMKDSLGPLAYPLGALIAGVREGGWSLHIEVDGEPLGGGDDRWLMVGLANGPSIGGGTRLCPGADPGDGLVDVVAVGATGPAARVAFGAALARGTHLERDDVVHCRGRAVTVTGDAVPYNADGELEEATTERRYRLLPGAWTLLVPPTVG